MTSGVTRAGNTAALVIEDNDPDDTKISGIIEDQRPGATLIDIAGVAAHSG